MSVKIFFSIVSDGFLDYRDLQAISRATMSRSRVRRSSRTTAASHSTSSIYIRTCGTVVHLVGDMPGSVSKSESATAVITKHPTIPRSSRHLWKKTWAFHARGGDIGDHISPLVPWQDEVGTQPLG